MSSSKSTSSFRILISILIQQMSESPLQSEPLNNESEPRPPSKPEEEEESALINNAAASQPYQPNPSEEAIDPLLELTRNNDVVPLLAVLPRLDLTTVVEGKPLLSRLCTMHLPLNQVLEGRELVFNKDSDNRTALHEAILADDVTSAYWCMKHHVQNGRDNFGFSPILEAIKLGRRACFLLCLHYQYYDSLAPHICATYNRAWELKVLHGMNMDVIFPRDSRHMTPLQTAVHYYSYEAAEFLTSIHPQVDTKELQKHTDSKAIIRLVEKTKNESSFFNYAVWPLLLFLSHLVALFSISSLGPFSGYSSPIGWALLLVVALQSLMYLSTKVCGPSPRNQPADVLQLLRAPEFPPFPEVCPYCLVLPGRDEQHCSKCRACMPRFHFHSTVCVNKVNEVFWLLTEIVWFWLASWMHEIMFDSFKLGSLNVLAFSDSLFFSNAAIIDGLVSSSNYFQLGAFVYLKLLMVYQFFCLFQWLCMLVLSRSYQEVNHSERYVRLYRIGRAMDGSYKSEEIRIMRNGLVMGIWQGIANICTYFLV